MSLTDAEAKRNKHHAALLAEHPDRPVREQMVKEALLALWAKEGRPDDIRDGMNQAIRLGHALDRQYGYLPSYEELCKWEAAGKPLTERPVIGG